MKRYSLNFCKKIILLLLSTLFGIICVEVIMRIFLRESIVLFPRYHTSAKYGEFTIRKHMPDMEFYHTSIEGKWHFMTNQKGFRNTQNFSYAKPANTLRILSIGDSHTFGYEVSQEETYSAQIEKMFSKDSINVQVINAGVSGFGTSEELIFLENEGVKYKPDYIILGFFRNDYDDNVRSNIFSLKQDSLVVASKEYIPGVSIQNIMYRFIFIKWLSENSYFYSYIFNTVWNFFKEASINKALSDSKEYAININQTIDEYKVKVVLKLLQRMYEFCQKNKIQLIIVDIPSWELNNNIVSSLDDLIIKSESLDCNYLVKCEYIKNDLKMTDILRRKGQHHISDKTHRLIAELCVSYIRSQISHHAD